MKRVFCLILCVLMIGAASHGRARGSTTAQDDDAERLIASEHAWAKSAVDNDLDTMAKFMSDDYIEIQLEPATPTAKAKWESTSKAAWIDLLRSGQEKYVSIELRNLKAYLHGDVATVTGEYSQTATKDGKNKSETGSYIDTWVKRNRKWYLVSSVFP